MTKDEALKLALEALTGNWTNETECEALHAKHMESITAIKEALALSESSTKCEETSHAQPDVDRRSTESKVSFDQQEPVACVGTNGELMWLNKSKVIYSKPIPLYTTPPHRKPLTEKEIDQITEQLDETTIGWSTHEFARAIEAAHGIKE